MKKLGNGGHSLENYDPKTGKYVSSDKNEVNEAEKYLGVKLGKNIKEITDDKKLSSKEIAVIDKKTEENLEEYKRENGRFNFELIDVDKIYPLLEYKWDEVDIWQETGIDRRDSYENNEKTIDSIIKNGIIPNIYDKNFDSINFCVYKNGYVEVGEGNHRVAIAKQLGLKNIPIRVSFIGYEKKPEIFKDGSTSGGFLKNLSTNKFNELLKKDAGINEVLSLGLDEERKIQYNSQIHSKIDKAKRLENDDQFTNNIFEYINGNMHEEDFVDYLYNEDILTDKEIYDDLKNDGFYSSIMDKQLKNREIYNFLNLIGYKEINRVVNLEEISEKIRDKIPDYDEFDDYDDYDELTDEELEELFTF